MQRLFHFIMQPLLLSCQHLATPTTFLPAFMLTHYFTPAPLAHQVENMAACAPGNGKAWVVGIACEQACGSKHLAQVGMPSVAALGHCSCCQTAPARTPLMPGQLPPLFDSHGPQAHRSGWPGTLCWARTGCCGRWRTCRCRWPRTTCAAQVRRAAGHFPVTPANVQPD